MSKKVLLTGDRPTGPLHLGHYVGSLRSRLELQESAECFIMVADAQAVTDNFGNIEKVRSNVAEVALDYLAVGLEPEKVCMFVQSMVPELFELTAYYLNIYSIQRIMQNPTVKAECQMRGFDESIPAGFALYPISQVADITAFRADLVPVGRDQTPMIELTRDVVKKFSKVYKTDVLKTPKPIYPTLTTNLPGIDGVKMSKSLGNAIYLSDEPEAVIKKIKKMKSDPNRKGIEEPGDPAKAIAFTYLDEFDPDKALVEDLKEHYRAGGLADKVVKERLVEVLLDFLAPIREKRKTLEGDIESVYAILSEGTLKARGVAAETLDLVKGAMGIRYDFLKSPVSR